MLKQTDGKFRKKSVVIEAERFREIRERGESVFVPDCVVKRFLRTGWWIKTLKGWCRVNLGDWIITDISGEKYPCRSYIFGVTYESVND